MKLVGMVVCLAIAAQGCGTTGSNGSANTDPKQTAEAYVRAFVAGDCVRAAKLVDEPDALWRAGCKDAFTFAIACEEIPGSGDPKSQDCGPGTEVKVRTVTAGKPEFGSDTAKIPVMVGYTQGRHTDRQRTTQVWLARKGGVWKVKKTS